LGSDFFTAENAENAENAEKLPESEIRKQKRVYLGVPGVLGG
jgi:hypothetical protein